MSTTTSQALEDDPKRPVNLLSLDAGGPQGVSQLLILKDVMDKLSKDESGDLQGTVKRPCEVFDMIGGVGTGGLIAIFLVVLKMTADQGLEEFSNFAVEVYKDVLPDPIKQTEKLTRAINGILERHGITKNAKLIPTSVTEAACKVVVPVMYRSHVGTPCVLRNYVSSHEPPVVLTIFEAMLATCSTPPIFTPTTISKDFATFEYVSGDIGLSNPTREIIAEAHRAFGDERSVSCLLSIGSGHPGVNALPEVSSGATWTNFVEKVAGDSERTAQDIGVQMGQVGLYYRLSVDRGLERNQVLEWEDSSHTTSHTVAYLNDLDVAGLVGRCVDAMQHGDGFTTLERLRHSGGVNVLTPSLPPLAANYVERKLPMEFIEKALFEEDRRIKPGSKRIFVTGIGGCGKTQLTRKFIEKYGDLFVSAFFIDGSSSETIRRDIVRHVRALGSAHSQMSFDESMVFLSQAVHGQRLLIIDNVDDSTLELTPFLPRWQNGAVIVTSRGHSRGQLSPTGHLQLDVMTVDESIELLIRGAGKIWLPPESDRVLAVSMAEELGCHPIALVQAISYMYNTGCTPGDYITLLRSSRDCLLRDHPATSQVEMRYTTAFAAFDASYNILPPKAQDLWHLLSFFRWQRFPIKLITVAALGGFSHEKYHYFDRGDDFELGKDCLKGIFYNLDRWDPLELNSILSMLRSHSLITTTSTENTVLLQMHPLIHEWGRLRLSETHVRRFEAAAIRLLCCSAKKENYAVMQYLPSHLEALTSKWDTMHPNDASSLVFILTESGNYHKAAVLGRMTHEMVRRQLGPNDIGTTHASTDLADACYYLGRYTEAEELMTGVLHQRMQQLGVEHADTIEASKDLAVIYNALGHYAKAEGLKTEVLRGRKQLLGLDHPDTIWSSASLAATYYALGRYAEAEELYTEVLQKRKQLLGVDHPDTIHASASLATTYHELGRYAEAEELDTEVLRRRKQLLGLDHPDTIHASASLATTYHVLGRYAEAEELYTEVLRGRKQLLGVDHPDTIRASANLAATYHELGRYAEAEELKAEVLRRRKQLLGVDHPDTIHASAELAVTYHMLGRHAEAAELKENVLRQRKLLFGANHPDTIRATAELAVAYYLLSHYAEAEELHTEVLKKRTTLLGERHPDTIRSMLYLAQTYNATQRQSKASPLAKKALQFDFETLGESHPLSKEILTFLASLPDETPVRVTRSGRYSPYKKRTSRKK